MPKRHDGHSSDPSSGESARTVTRADRTSNVERTETRQVLMHRVIALNGVPEVMADKPKPQPVDLSRTVHEWGVEPHLPVHQAPMPKIEASPEPRWATHSSISLESCEDAGLPARILSANIEDAVTQQFNPATVGRSLPLATSIGDLSSLDRALESAGVLEAHAHALGAVTIVRPPPEPEPQHVPTEAPQPAPAQPQPRMLLVPMSIVWTVLTVFSLCTLALTALVILVVLRN